MARDFIPTADSELTVWLKSFVTQLNSRAESLNLGPKDLATLENAATLFDSSLMGSRQAADEAKAATAQKRAARRAALRVVRPLVRQLQANPAMTDEYRSALGLTLRDAPATTTASVAADESPLVDLDFGTRGQITIHFGPNPAERNRNGLPSGVLGAVIQAAPLTGQQAASIPTVDASAGWQWLDNATRSPLVHKPDPAGSRHWAYRVAYLYRRGRRGPWSAAAVASVTF
jgi:hypothetical protein